jgi:signal transduction histidine kinase
MLGMFRRPSLIYGLLVTAWAVIVAWQTVEHHRVKESARAALINRSKDIADIISGVIGSATFRGIVLQDRLESMLNRLVKPGELISVALLNASNHVVANVGKPIDLASAGVTQDREHWGQKTVTFVNPVDLGAGVTPAGETNRPTIILPRRDPAAGPREDDRQPRPRGEPRRNDAGGPGAFNGGSNSMSGPPNLATGAFNSAGNNLASTNSPERRPGRPRFGRPPWMSEDEYKSLIERRGVHGLVIVMSTQSLQAATTQDLWLRSIIGVLGAVAAAGLALAWRNVVKSSDLQIRLLRASELNNHLKAMNIAAAGLAHETRNPLNIIRGLAQMISKQQDASPEIRRKSRDIVDETDRVTAQLNEFINYSRPREVRRVAVVLGSVIGEVVGALNYDLEEKKISLQVVKEPLSVEADEQLLRQALFNLLLNAIQAVDRNGEIQVTAHKDNASEAFVEIRDNGPGVSPEHYSEIFKPYFSTYEKGTGLGLAVVQQIVLAHGWEIEYVPNQPKGAIFRISHLKLATKF